MPNSVSSPTTETRSPFAAGAAPELGEIALTEQVQIDAPTTPMAPSDTAQARSLALALIDQGFKAGKL